MTTVIKKGTSKEEIKKRLNTVISEFPKKDIMKYAGTIDPMKCQIEMRNEWE